MLEHAGEAFLSLFGFWRFLLSASYRERKLREWRAARTTLGGKAAIAAEVLAAVAFGVLLPLSVIVLAVSSR